MAQPTKKAPIKKGVSLNELKGKMGIKVTVENGQINGVSNADKKMDWLILPDAYREAIKLPGFPLGYVSTICGHSNTGKSTLVNHAIVAAQKQGYLPVIFDTESNFDFNYAVDMGMKATPVYADIDEEIYDPETGEVTIKTENKLVYWDGDFIYYNGEALRQAFGNIDYSTGKVGSSYRTKPVIEDMVYAINTLLEEQQNGNLDQYKGILFLWDSVGSIAGLRTYNSKVGNNQFDAGTISIAFQDIMESAIPSSRKVSSKFTNTMVMVNKVWLDSQSNPMAPPSLELKGGKSITYRSRLILLLGGQLKPSIKRLSAVSKGETYNWGIQTKIKVLKNQLPSPYDLTYEGEFICTGLGIISTSKEAQDEFKKTKVPMMMKRKLEGKIAGEISEGDIKFNETNVELDNSMLE